MTTTTETLTDRVFTWILDPDSAPAELTEAEETEYSRQLELYETDNPLAGDDDYTPQAEPEPSLRCLDCRKPLASRKTTKGPAPKRCPDCAKKRQAGQKKAYKTRAGKKDVKPPCCQNGTCPQHVQAREATRESLRHKPRPSEASWLFSVFTTDDSHGPERPLPKEHDAAEAWLAEHDPDRAKK